ARASAQAAGRTGGGVPLEFEHDLFRKPLHTFRDHAPSEQDMIRLRSHDGHELDAYLARPTGAVRGGLVGAQEMYGINAYLRAVCECYAAQGYVAIAPALYDRKQRGLTYNYTDEGHDRAQRTYKAWDLNLALDDLEAAHAAIADAGKVGMVG